MKKSIFAPTLILMLISTNLLAKLNPQPSSYFPKSIGMVIYTHDFSSQADLYAVIRQNKIVLTF